MAKTQDESDLSVPEEMFGWMFAAGIPDPRGDKFPNQPLVPATCFPALSKMLYDFGCRFHPEEQKIWVEKASGPTRNFEAWGTTNVKPEVDAAAMLADIAPEKAALLAQVTPQNHKDVLAKTTADLLESLERLKVAREAMDKGGAA